MFSGNEKCQTFVGCTGAATTAQTKPAKKLLRRQEILETKNKGATGAKGKVTEILPCVYIILN